jgi:hypothetical protein
MQGLIAGLETLPLVGAMRATSWVYALASALHVTGIALLFGPIALADFRLVGATRSPALAAALPALSAAAACGLAVAAATGLMLFGVRPAEYLGNPYFPWKLGAIAGGLLNVIALRVAARGRPLPAIVDTHAARVCGALSLGLWLAAIWLGRMLAFAD